MKLRICLFIIVALTILLNDNTLSAPFDTGMITFEQPNAAEFTGRIWGDEFFWWAETEDGYRFVQSGDGWYYYATLDQNGEFTKTIYKVGIDSPPASSYKLERTQTRNDEINEEIGVFNEQVELNREWFAQKQAEAQGQPVTLKVGIILIKFQDVEQYCDTIPPITRPNGYYAADFDSMMFSYNYWYAPDPQYISPHPENEFVFGSFRDYWDQISCAKLKITGKVVNPDTTGNGVPEWLKVNHTRSYYADTCAYLSDSLANEAIQKALEYNYISNSPGDSNYYDKYAIVYAQEAIPSRALMVHAESINGKFLILAERSGPKLYNGSIADKSFTHIGVYAHESGHLIGFYDEYYDPSQLLEDNPPTDGWPTDIYNFCLMAFGIYNGPLSKGECPATLSPYWRIDKTWVSPILIPNDTSDFIVEYNYAEPKLYRINPLNSLNNEHFILEDKCRTGFDLYIPGDPADSVNQPGRLIVWHSLVDLRAYGDYDYDRVTITPADDSLDKDTQLYDFFPKLFDPNLQSLNDTTSPSAYLGGKIEDYWGTWSNERSAHFALNGIQKLENGNTLIDEVKLTYGLSTITNSGGWLLASVPLVLTDYYYTSVYPSCLAVYKFDGTYISVDTLENGTGYWMHFPQGTQETTMFGDYLKYLSIPVDSGWNIMGTINFDVPVITISSVPSNIIDLIYNSTSGLMTDDSILTPGEGYWVKTNKKGNIILDRNAEPGELEKTTNLPHINLAEMDKFIITDSAGFSQRLYVSNIDIDTALANITIDLPPLFPEIDFDARFYNNDYIKKVCADSGTIDISILVHTNSYPISLAWEINPENGIEYSFVDSTLDKVTQIIEKNGQARFTKNSKGRIKLFGRVIHSNHYNQIPDRYELFQNFPNPFNATTTIKYAIPKTVSVELKVFDILGREVNSLVNETKNAGYYEVEFDASSLASGVYFYRIKATPIGGQAGDFVQTKKMILLK